MLRSLKQIYFVYFVKWSFLFLFTGLLGMRKERLSSSVVKDISKVAKMVKVACFLFCKGDINAQGNNGCTALHEAVEDDNQSLVKFLINKNAKVNIQDARKNTSLHIALWNGNMNIVPLLVESKADFSLQNKLGDTPLSRVIKDKNFECLRYFIEHNGDVNQLRGESDLPLHYVCKHNTYYAHDFEKWITFLVENKADFNFKNNEGRVPLCEILNNLQHVKLLVHQKADVHVKDNRGEGLLHYTDAFGSLNVLEFLIASNVNINMQSKNGLTPLHAAAFYKKVPFMNLLIQKKASLSAVDNKGRGLLHYAMLDWKDKEFKFLYYEENHAREMEICTESILKYNVDVNIVDKEGQHLLFWFMQRPSMPLHVLTRQVQLLLKAGCRIVDLNSFGYGLFHMLTFGCSEQNFLEKCTLFLDLPFFKTMYDARKTLCLAHKRKNCVISMLPKVLIKLIALKYMDPRRDALRHKNIYGCTAYETFAWMANFTDYREYREILLVARDMFKPY